MRSRRSRCRRAWWLTPSRSTSTAIRVADHVVLRIGTPLLNDVVVDEPGLDAGLNTLFGRCDVAELPLEHLVQQKPDVLTRLRRHAQHLGDHFHREQGRKVLHDIELVGIRRGEKSIDLFDDHLALPFDRAGGEHLVHQVAHPTVPGRIHHDDQRRHRISGLHHLEIDSA